ncbi:MAG TPA: hypothetical protein VK174_09180 [Chitinophagales bacterium]|nr:hypothetical protein [Chitinophagales bacterium]
MANKRQRWESPLKADEPGRRAYGLRVLKYGLLTIRFFLLATVIFFGEDDFPTGHLLGWTLELIQELIEAMESEINNREKGA